MCVLYTKCRSASAFSIKATNPVFNKKCQDRKDFNTPLLPSDCLLHELLNTAASLCGLYSDNPAIPIIGEHATL